MRPPVQIVSSCPLEAPGMGKRFQTRVQGLENRMLQMTFAMVEVQDHLNLKDNKQFDHEVEEPPGYAAATDAPTEYPTIAPTEAPTKAYK